MAVWEKHRSHKKAEERRIAPLSASGEACTLKWTSVCQLIVKHRRHLRMYILSKVRDPGDADDVEQEVSLHLLRAGPPRDPLALLRIIAKRVIADQRRKQGLRDHAPLSEADDVTPAAVAMARHHEEESIRDARIDLDKALQEVGRTYWLGCAVFMAFYAGYTAKEIGREMGLKAKDVYRLRDRTIARFRKFLGTSSGRRDK
jgi:RNA polymerase sigma factor (sigma-70 family)